jgi:hypothetical protein
MERLVGFLIRRDSRSLMEARIVIPSRYRSASTTKPFEF